MADIKDRISSSSDSLEGQFAVEYKKGELVFMRIIEGKDAEASLGIATQLKRLFSFTQDERQFLKFPIRSGDKWQVNFRRQFAGSRISLNVSDESKVIGFKEINVAAGRFKVAELRRDGHFYSDRSYYTETKMLYSPDTGCVVQYFEDTNVGGKGAKVTVELTKFTPAK